MEIKQNRGYKLPISKLQIIEAYQSGKSCYKLATICKCTPQTIFSILKKANIPRRTLSKAATKYTHDITYFDQIDTAEKAYFLGLLYADGNISKNVLSISLQEEDKIILEKFKMHIKYTGPVKLVKKTGNRKQQYRLSITSQFLVSALFKYGLYPNKGTSLIFPVNLNSLLYSHFIRGYFDGDGCIYTNNNHKDYLFSIVGPYQFLEYIQNILIDNLQLNKTKLYNPKNCKINNLHILTYQGRNNLIKIRKFLYKDHTLYLNRKYLKFHSF
jgi:intein-encoded DNA endonuclease-like protein